MLKRLGASPLPRDGLLLGKVVSLLVVEAGQLVLICSSRGSRWAGSRTAACRGLVGAVAAGAAGHARPSRALGLLMAGTLRAEATLAAANLVYVVLLVGGGVVVPLSSYPAACSAVVVLLPSGALAEGLRELCAGRRPRAGPVSPCSLVWAAVAGRADRADVPMGVIDRAGRVASRPGRCGVACAGRQHRHRASPAAPCG